MDQELKRRKDLLLKNDNLKKKIEWMINVKNLPVKFESLTVIGGGWKSTEMIVIDLKVLVKKEYVSVVVYIPEGIYWDGSFFYIDKYIPDGTSIDSWMFLRALRVIYTVIKDISSGDWVIQDGFIVAKVGNDGKISYNY